MTEPTKRDLVVRSLAAIIGQDLIERSKYGVPAVGTMAEHIVDAVFPVRERRKPPLPRFALGAGIRMMEPPQSGMDGLVGWRFRVTDAGEETAVLTADRDHTGSRLVTLVVHAEDAHCFEGWA